MTEKEAIEELKEEWGRFGKATPCDTSYGIAVNESYKMAITALEKQIPKKPKEYEDKYYACPVCDNILMHKWEKYPEILTDKKNGLPYCLCCGQKLDWSENPKE